MENASHMTGNDVYALFWLTLQRSTNTSSLSISISNINLMFPPHSNNSF